MTLKRGQFLFCFCFVDEFAFDIVVVIVVVIVVDALDALDAFLFLLYLQFLLVDTLVTI